MRSKFYKNLFYQIIIFIDCKLFSFKLASYIIPIINQIKGDKMSKVVTQLNQIQADAHALFIKFHDYHWNVKGIQFFSVHEYTEKAYEDMAEIFDDAAERAIQLGGKAVTKPEELNKLAHPKIDNKGSYTPTEVLNGILGEYEHLLGEFKKLEEVADKAKDSTTVAMAQDKIAKYEKAIWMLKATLA